MRYVSKARRKWRRAEWIEGEGRFALLAHCRVLTVTLWGTAEAARKAMRELDEGACGGKCNMNHEVVDIDDGRVVAPDDSDIDRRDYLRKRKKLYNEVSARLHGNGPMTLSSMNKAKEVVESALLVWDEKPE